MITGKLKLLKPSPDVCQECAVNHLPEQPHNRDSLYYQIWFYDRYGRYPTWKDAIAHCSDKLKFLWKKELTSRGVWTEPRKGKNDKGK